MSGGGLMQLVAYGQMNCHLNGNPQITFFKSQYKRHTNFSMEHINVYSQNGNAVVGETNKKCVFTIPRNGDLVSGITLTSNTSGIQNGMAIIKSASISIGGQTIDKFTGEWMQIYNELYTPESRAHVLKKVTGCCASQNEQNSSNGGVYIPLPFWFCKDYSQALPLISMQYQEVQIEIEFGTIDEVGVAAECELMVGYVYLDSEERKRFAQTSHEFLIDQVHTIDVPKYPKKQFSLSGSTHTAKEIFWTYDDEYEMDPNTKGTILLNGYQRFEYQPLKYFQQYQPMKYHTSVPAQNIPTDQSKNMEILDEPITLFESNYYEDELTVENGYLNLPTTDHVKINKGDVLILMGSGQINRSARVVKAIDGCGLYIDIFDCLLGINKVLLVVQSKKPEARTSKMTNKINSYSFGLKPELHTPTGQINLARIDTTRLVFDKPVKINKIYTIGWNILRIENGMASVQYANSFSSHDSIDDLNEKEKYELSQHQKNQTKPIPEIPIMEEPKPVSDPEPDPEPGVKCVQLDNLTISQRRKLRVEDLEILLEKKDMEL